MINEAIKKLVCYGLERGLIKKEDKIYTTNALLEVLGIDEYQEPEETYEQVELEPVLKELLGGLSTVCLNKHNKHGFCFAGRRFYSL